MKRGMIVCAVGVLVLGFTAMVQAAAVSITFDETGIAVGDTVTDQYASQGVTWIKKPFQDDELQNEVTTGANFGKNSFDSEGRILWYNGETTAEGVIALDFLANALSFEYRRPSSSAEIQVRLYKDYVQVYDSDPFLWDSGDWETFAYPDSKAFDLIWMYSPSSNKFVIDNLEITPVPAPTSLLLLASGLFPMAFRRMKK